MWKITLNIARGISGIPIMTVQYYIMKASL